jgi:HK97 family phage prohead protease
MADPALELRKTRAEALDGAREVRRFDVSGLELRDTSDGMLRFSGYASITEHPYEVADFQETIARGAFKRTLSEDPDVVLLVNHEGLPLARTKSGTLTLSEDARGLRVDADLNPQDPDVRSLVPKMQRGDVDQMSFAFRATAQDWNEDYTERTIRGVALHRGDVSIVTMGANDATTSSVTTIRSADGSVELRAGKSISSANETALKRVLDVVASIDEGADEAQGLLAGVLGVENPDADDDDARRAEELERPEREAWQAAVDLNRYRQRVAALRRTA